MATDHDRAVAWLDAHPEIVEAASLAGLAAGGEWAPFAEAHEDFDPTRAALVAFLTSPLPCATCDGKHRVLNFDATTWVNCPDCTDGTAGILLDQLEARYEQVGEE